MKVLCVHSFAVHGTASMKAILSILGTSVLPVSSIYLSGLTNIPGFVKTELAFEELLFSSFELAKKRGDQLLLYVGYLGEAKQAELISKAIETYRDIIKYIVVDPVSGDQGRMYVPEEVLEVWPQLLAEADWALPNYTELKYHSALLEEGKSVENYMDAFSQRFPKLSFITTSLPHPTDLKLAMHMQGEIRTVLHKKLNVHFGGTGDVFAAHFIKYAFLEKRDKYEAMNSAAHKTLEIIEDSFERRSPDLLIEPKV